MKNNQILWKNNKNYSILKQGKCTRDICNGSLMTPRRADSKPRPKDELLELAKQFIDEYYQSMNR